MEDRAKPNAEEEHSRIVSANEERRGRARRAVSSLFDKGEARPWSKILSGEDDSSDEDDEESNEQSHDTHESSDPKASRAQRIAESMRALFERPNRTEQDENGADARRKLPKASEFLFSDFSGLMPSAESATDVSENDSEADDEPAEGEIDHDSSDALELPPVAPEFVDTDEDDEPTVNQVAPPVTPPSSGGSAGPPPYTRTRTPQYTPPPVPPVQVVNVHNYNTPNHVTNIHNVEVHARDERLRGAVAGLLLVDLVDYVATKRREGKMKKENKAEHKQITKEQVAQRSDHVYLAERTRQLEVSAAEQAEKLRKEAEKNRIQKLQQQTIVQNRVEMRAQDIKTADIQNTQLEVMPVTERTILEKQPQQAEKPIKPEVMAPEQILKVVEKAAEENVAIESLYERRHEARGNESAGQWVQQSGASTTAPTKEEALLDQWTGQSVSNQVEYPVLPKQTKKQLSDPLQQTSLIIFGVLVIVIIIFLFLVIFTR